MKPLQIITLNFLFLGVAQVVALVSSFLLIAILARSFDPVTFGWYGLVSAWVAVLIPVPFLGTTRVFEREAARRPGEIGALFTATLLIRAIGGIIVVATLGAGAWLIQGMSWRLALSAGLWVLFGALAGACTEVFVAREQTHHEASATTLYKTLLVAGVALAISGGGGVASVFAVKGVSRLVQFAWMLRLIQRVGVRVEPRVDFRHVRLLLREGFPLQLSELLQMGFFKIDEIILGSFGQLNNVGIFHAPYQIMLGLSLLPQQIMRAAFPEFARQVGAPGRHDVFRRVSDLMIWFGVVVSAIVFTIAPMVTSVLLGDGYAESGTCLRLLCLAVPFVFLEILLRFTLVSLGKQRIDAIGLAWGLALNGGLDLILVPAYGWQGACLGTLGAQVLIVAFVWRTTRREADLPGLSRSATGSIAAATAGAVMFACGLPWVSGVAVALGLVPLTAKITSGERRKLRLSRTTWRILLRTYLDGGVSPISAPPQNPS